MAAEYDASNFEFSDPLACIDRVRNDVSERNILSALHALEKGAARFPVLMDLPEAQLLAGKIARARERFKEARQCFRRSARDAKFNVESTYEIARVWLEAGRLELAVDAFLRVAHDEKALIPYRCHAWSGLCVCYAGLERVKSAEQAIKNAAEFGLVSAQLLADEAKYLTIGGAAEEAQAQLARALQIDTGCIDAFMLLANLFHVNGRSKEAKEILAYGIENSPHAIKLLSLMGEVHFSQGEFKEAAAFYRRCLEISPLGANADPIRLSLAKSFHKLRRGKLAKRELETLLERHPRSVYRREARERLKNLEANVRASHLIENFPRKLQKRHYCAPNTLANVLAFFGNQQSQDRIAEDVFTQGTRWNDLVSFLEGLPEFKTYAFHSDLNQVKDILKNDVPVIVGEYSGIDGHCIALIGFDDQMGVVLAQDPLYYDPVEIPYSEFLRSWDFTDNLAVVVVPLVSAETFDLVEKDDEALIKGWLEALDLRDAAKYPEARTKLQALIDEEPEFTSARRSLIEIALYEQDAESARTEIQETLEREPNSYWVLRYAGDLAMIGGDYVLALEYYARAVRIYPNDPTLHYMRGEIALSVGDRKRGRAELVQALEEQPSAIPPRIRLAQDYLDAQDHYHACYHAEAALELAPNDPRAQELVEAVKTIAPDTVQA